MLFLYLFCTSKSQYAFAENQYARIETTTQIFKSTSGNETIENIYCLAEESYYVEIIGDYDNYFRVNYNGINGYVKKNDVKEVSNSPSTPYPYNINIVVGSNCNLRSSPTTNSTTSNVISTIYSKENDIIFIGRTIGEEAIDFGGSTWYYVCYKGNYGYIYNNYIQSITPIYPNNESFSYAENISQKIENPITHTPSLIIIFILMIPLFAVLFLLYLPKKHTTKSKSHKPTKSTENY